MSTGSSLLGRTGISGALSCRSLGRLDSTGHVKTRGGARDCSLQTMLLDHSKAPPPAPFLIPMEQITRCWTQGRQSPCAPLNKHVHLLKRHPLSQALGTLLPTHSLHRPSAEPILPQNRNSTRKEH